MQINTSPITKKLRERGLLHEAKFVPSDDQTTDAEIEFRLFGVPSHVSVQCCEVGGGYATNREVFKNGKCTAVIFGRVHGSLDAAVDEALNYLG